MVGDNMLFSNHEGGRIAGVDGENNEIKLEVIP